MQRRLRLHLRAAVALPLLLVGSLSSGCVETDSASEFARSESPMSLSWSLPGSSAAVSTASVPSVTWLEEISVPGMKSPLRVAVSEEGSVAVSDPKASKVFVLSPQGWLDHTITALQEPLGVAFGRGKLYVGDAATGAVFAFSDVGPPLMLGRGYGEFQMPNELLYDPTDDVLYVVDSKRDVILGYDAAGRLVKRLGGSGQARGQFHFPTGIGLDPSGNLLLADHSNARVQVFASDGTWIRAFGSYGEGAGKLARPQGVAVDEEGRIYVVDAFDGRVQVFDEQGAHVSWLGVAGAGTGRLSLPMDAALDPYHRLWVTSPGRSAVLVYGIDAYTEPEPALAVDMSLHPSVVGMRSEGRWLETSITLPPESNAELDRRSLRLAGVAPDPAADGHQPSTLPQGEERAYFSRRAVLASVRQPGTYTLELTGKLSSGQPITATARIRVVGHTGGAR